MGGKSCYQTQSPWPGHGGGAKEVVLSSVLDPRPRPEKFSRSRDELCSRSARLVGLETCLLDGPPNSSSSLPTSQLCGRVSRALSPRAPLHSGCLNSLRFSCPQSTFCFLRRFGLQSVPCAGSPESVIRKIAMKHILCVRHGSRHWGSGREQGRVSPWLPGADILEAFTLTTKEAL